MLVACNMPPAHTFPGPTPYYTKDTICCICKEIVTSIAPEDGRISPKHVELKILICIKLVNYFIFQTRLNMSNGVNCENL